MGRTGRCDRCLGSVLQADILGAELGCNGAHHLLHWLWHRRACFAAIAYCTEQDYRQCARSIIMSMCLVARPALSWPERCISLGSHSGILHGFACFWVLAAGIAFYLYFLTTQREFAYREWKNQMMTRLQVHTDSAAADTFCSSAILHVASIKIATAMASL